MNSNILVETEGLSKEDWLKYRKMGIGGSDVSCLLGINKWKSEIELWLDKTNQTDDLPVENEAMQWGTIMEPVIRDHFIKVTGKKVVEVPAMLQHPEYAFMLANVDGLTVDDAGNPAILEIKTASEYKRSDWENDIPVYYQTQVQHYLCVTGVIKAYVAVLIGGNTFSVYEVDADAEVQQMLVVIEQTFWDKVEKMIRPEIDGSDAAKNLINSMYSGGISKQLILPEDAVEFIDQYIEACAEEDNAKAKKQEAANHIKELMGNHEKTKCLDYTISWKSVTSERLDTKALKAAEPELYSKYVKTSTSRRFTLK
jgi:putative phage-type endonuclease